MPATLSTIILAAGRGTRMCSALPKVLHPVAGRSLLRHAMEHILPLTDGVCITVIGPDMENVEREARNIHLRAKIAIQNSRLGTGDAVKCALDAVIGSAEMVLVAYGDTPFVATKTIQKLLEATLNHSASVGVLGFRPKISDGYGRLITKNNSLLRIVEHKDATEEEKKITLCNSGVMIIKTDQLRKLLGKLKNNNAKGEYYLTDIVEHAIAEGARCTYVEAPESELLGVNSPAELAYAEQLMQRHLRERMLENGVQLRAPETVFFSMDTKIASGTIIHPYVVFGPGVTIHESVEIRAFSHIEGAVIGKDSGVGPFARLRPGTELGERCHIGNFVELKKTSLGDGSKAGHLSYLGDTTTGKNVNVGAGTVTCNYDGYDKYQTVIGENSFIGSQTALVAPITVGRGVITGAGATILKDVPDDALALTEQTQHNISDGAAAFHQRKREKE